MTMTKRKKIIIISGLVVLVLILLIVLIWFWLNPKAITSVFEPKQETGLQIPANLPSASSALPDASTNPIKEPKTEASIKAIAVTFTERFGSFSSQSNYANLDSLKAISSRKMINYLESLKVASGNEDYTGITTQALITEVLSFSDTTGRAEIKVTTKRQESSGSTINPQEYYQDLNLKLVKEDGSWKVDQADWGSKK